MIGKLAFSSVHGRDGTILQSRILSATRRSVIDLPPEAQHSGSVGKNGGSGT
jgi:hypothetical protein